MPFVFGPNRISERPFKKRKLLNFHNMAGSSGKEKWSHDWLPETYSEPHDTDSREHSNQDEERVEEIRTSSREELIECIKRGQNPTWVPKPGLQALREEEEALQEKRKSKMRDQPNQSVSPKDVSHDESITLIQESEPVAADPIARPRSALHAGDFSEQPLTTAANFCRQHGHDLFSPEALSSFSSSPPSWPLSSPPRNFTRSVSNPNDLQKLDMSQIGRQRAPSLGSSLSSSFVMRTPTSPLVHATSNPYLDTPQDQHDARMNEQVRNHRRRTMPPHAFQATSSSPLANTLPTFSRPLSAILQKRDPAMPYQTHQPRRSLTSFTYQPRMTPQTPPPRARRLSATSDVQSRRRSSMVGSFEESILRGRMSTAPSQPLDFVAQIGVMGKGDCPSNLKCPAHVSIPFPAVFYNYPAAPGSRSLADDTPSPYVGTVDLERNLKPVLLDTKRRKSHQDTRRTGLSETGTDSASSGAEHLYTNNEAKQKSKPQTSMSIGGAYRIPKQGQLQIIIKNPNKTAVKLFLVPYDLDGMEPGTKTFVRQRSFSSGPIIENILIDKATKQTTSDPLENKLILRYLIHLKFCCPSKGRYYLHESIRVVFANRVPDGKERLRNEIQLPEPKFSIYKPVSMGSQLKSSVSSPATPTAFTPDFSSPTRFFGDIDGLESNVATQTEVLPTPINHQRAAIPLHFSDSRRWRSPSPPIQMPSSNYTMDQLFQFPDASLPSQEGSQLERTLSPVNGFKASASKRVSPVPWSPTSSSSTARSFSPTPMEAGSGLLSKQFRELNDRDQQAGWTMPHGPSNTTKMLDNRDCDEQMPSDGDIGLARMTSK